MDGWIELLAPRREMLSRRWRGIMVTSSDSARKDTSAGVRPVGGCWVVISGFCVLCEREGGVLGS